jgi:hypothetical protein
MEPGSGGSSSPDHQSLPDLRDSYLILAITYLRRLWRTSEAIRVYATGGGTLLTAAADILGTTAGADGAHQKRG